MRSKNDAGPLHEKTCTTSTIRLYEYPLDEPQHPSRVSLVENKPRNNVPTVGLYLTPTYTGAEIVHSRMSYSLDTHVPRAGVLFLQADFSNTFEHRRHFLHIEIYKSLLEHTEGIITSLQPSSSISRHRSTRQHPQPTCAS
jgi:hypothetical protein